MLDLSKITNPIFVVSLGGMIEVTPYSIIGGKLIDETPEQHSYLKGVIGLVDPKITAGLEKATQKTDTVWRFDAKMCPQRVDPQPNPIEVIVLPPMLTHCCQLTDSGHARITTFDASSLIAMNESSKNRQIKEIQKILTCETYFPDGGFSYTQKQIWEIIIFLEIAATVYKDKPERIIRC